jgi:hypothetical protein
MPASKGYGTFAKAFCGAPGAVSMMDEAKAGPRSHKTLTDCAKGKKVSLFSFLRSARWEVCRAHFSFRNEQG